ncbi:hypothetical protein [uncultured Paraglaciecola sp.]|uniref:hypothetical protein n=1 Tax=uncultured Paraglaciecola sp. TaxID=1765024 RepID=UPI002614263D|nr:hypothetical protein [uncultured Paraglaciecola sp.]
MKTKEKMLSIITIRGCVLNGSPVDRYKTCNVPASEARVLIGNGKAVLNDDDGVEAVKQAKAADESLAEARKKAK